MSKSKINEFEEEVEFSQEEEAYRRGYIHGFVSGRNTDTDFEEVRKWRYGNELVAPPGSGLAGMKLKGLTWLDKDEFFLNKLKNLQDKDLK